VRAAYSTGRAARPRGDPAHPRWGRPALPSPPSAGGMEPHPVSRFPKCRLCQDEHRLGPCPSFYSQPSRVTPAAAARREEVRQEVVESPARRAKGAGGVANRAVTNGVANSPERSVREDSVSERAVRGPVAARDTSSERVRRWRAANREKYNAAQRERMRAFRAARRDKQAAH
jgi:hypothetical protein